jgi:hypothetical protein
MAAVMLADGRAVKHFQGTRLEPCRSWSNRSRALSFCLSMIFRENRYPPRITSGACFAGSCLRPPRSCPDIAADRPEADGFQPGYQRNLLEHSSKLSKPMNLPPRLATNQSGVSGFMSDQWDDFDEQPGAAHPIRNGRIAAGCASGGEPAGRASLRAVARAGRIARRAGLRIAQPDPDFPDALPRKAVRGRAGPKNQLALIVATIFSNPTQG